MAPKDPVLLTVLLESAELRWWVAGIGLDGTPLPLMCSEPGNLGAYRGQPFDEQVSFLRHRLCGVLQRGCDRLWGRQKKPCHIVLVADAVFPDATPELTSRVAEHFVVWMTSPPVAFFLADGFAGPLRLNQIVGELAPAFRQALDTCLPALLAARSQAEVWELAPPKATSFNP